MTIRTLGYILIFLSVAGLGGAFVMDSYLKPYLNSLRRRAARRRFHKQMGWRDGWDR